MSLFPRHYKLFPSKVHVKSRIYQTLGYNILLLNNAMEAVTENQTAIFMTKEVGIRKTQENNPWRPAI